jgi:hypothetical protein
MEQFAQPHPLDTQSDEDVVEVVLLPSNGGAAAAPAPVPLPLPLPPGADAPAEADSVVAAMQEDEPEEAAEEEENEEDVEMKEARIEKRTERMALAGSKRNANSSSEDEEEDAKDEDYVPSEHSSDGEEVKQEDEKEAEAKKGKLADRITQTELELRRWRMEEESASESSSSSDEENDENDEDYAPSSEEEKDDDIDDETLTKRNKTLKLAREEAEQRINARQRRKRKVMRGSVPDDDQKPGDESVSDVESDESDDDDDDTTGVAELKTVTDIALNAGLQGLLGDDTVNKKLHKRVRDIVLEAIKAGDAAADEDDGKRVTRSTRADRKKLLAEAIAADTETENKHIARGALIGEKASDATMHTTDIAAHARKQQDAGRARLNVHPSQLGAFALIGIAPDGDDQQPAAAAKPPHKKARVITVTNPAKAADEKGSSTAASGVPIVAYSHSAKSNKESEQILSTLYTKLVKQLSDMLAVLEKVLATSGERFAEVLAEVVSTMLDRLTEDAEERHTLVHKTIATVNDFLVSDDASSPDDAVIKAKQKEIADAEKLVAQWQGKEVPKLYKIQLDTNRKKLPRLQAELAALEKATSRHSLRIPDVPIENAKIDQLRSTLEGIRTDKDKIAKEHVASRVRAFTELRAQKLKKCEAEHKRRLTKSAIDAYIKEYQARQLTTHRRNVRTRLAEDESKQLVAAEDVSMVKADRMIASFTEPEKKLYETWYAKGTPTERVQIRQRREDAEQIEKKQVEWARQLIEQARKAAQEKKLPVKKLNELAAAKLARLTDEQKQEMERYVKAWQQILPDALNTKAVRKRKIDIVCAVHNKYIEDVIEKKAQALLAADMTAAHLEQAVNAWQRGSAHIAKYTAPFEVNKSTTRSEDTTRSEAIIEDDALIDEHSGTSVQVNSVFTDGSSLQAALGGYANPITYQETKAQWVGPFLVHPVDVQRDPRAWLLLCALARDYAQAGVRGDPRRSRFAAVTPCPKHEVFLKRLTGPELPSRYYRLFQITMLHPWKHAHSGRICIRNVPYLIETGTPPAPEDIAKFTVDTVLKTLNTHWRGLFDGEVRGAVDDLFDDVIHVDPMYGTDTAYVPASRAEGKASLDAALTRWADGASLATHDWSDNTYAALLLATATIHPAVFSNETPVTGKNEITVLDTPIAAFPPSDCFWTVREFTRNMYMIRTKRHHPTDPLREWTKSINAQLHRQDFFLDWKHHDLQLREGVRSQTALTREVAHTVGAVPVLSANDEDTGYYTIDAVRYGGNARTSMLAFSHRDIRKCPVCTQSIWHFIRRFRDRQRANATTEEIAFDRDHYKRDMTDIDHIFLFCGGDHCSRTGPHSDAFATHLLADCVTDAVAYPAIFLPTPLRLLAHSDYAPPGTYYSTDAKFRSRGTQKDAVLAAEYAASDESKAVVDFRHVTSERVKCMRRDELLLAIADMMLRAHRNVIWHAIEQLAAFASSEIDILLNELIFNDDFLASEFFSQDPEAGVVAWIRRVLSFPTVPPAPPPMPLDPIELKRGVTDRQAFITQVRQRGAVASAWVEYAIKAYVLKNDARKDFTANPDAHSGFVVDRLLIEQWLYKERKPNDPPLAGVLHNPCALTISGFMARSLARDNRFVTHAIQRRDRGKKTHADDSPKYPGGSRHWPVTPSRGC